MALVNREVHCELYSRILREEATDLLAGEVAAVNRPPSSGSGAGQHRIQTTIRSGVVAPILARERPSVSEECSRPLIRRRVVPAAEDSAAEPAMALS